MTIEEFQHEIFQHALDSPICGIPIVRLVTPASVNLRIPLTFGNFIDIFYNEESGTTAYALIEKGRRILGADNTGGWHIHPFENPELHETIDQPVRLRDFLQNIDAYYKHGSQHYETNH